MKWLFLAALLMCAPVVRAAPDLSAQAVPRGHWTYEALQKLASVRVHNVLLLDGAPKEKLQPVLAAKNGLTRYQATVVIARIVDMLVEQPPLTAPLDLSAVRNLPLQSVTSAEADLTPDDVGDFMAALQREYGDELARLDVRFKSSEPPVPRPKTDPAAVAAAPQKPESPVVPRGHWVYEALQKLTCVRVDGKRLVTWPQRRMTRLECAVIVARALDVIPTTPDKIQFDDPDFTLPEMDDLINALRREFADELAQMGVRAPLESRHPMEGRVAKPPRMTITPSWLRNRNAAVSATFAEILARVAKRDEATGAIIGVKRKDDAPQSGNAAPVPLRFSLGETADGRSAIIVLKSGIEGDENVYETYRLSIDAAIREELRLQKLLQEAQKAK